MKKKKQQTPKTERVLPTPELLEKFDVEEKQTQKSGERRTYVTNQQ